ncbi:HAD family hydrolase [Synechococcus sp. CBW1107]|uniref:HAD family hydrolase n=1 Tax=Synechococcus sp. CBW1107 TaxID=2789857 RepID=UPI002AD44AB0|nr:HAD family hydrolase [Synechococcus sp. CBW1107]CAK6701488.1 hypothetical protein IFHNHDMJ_03122 [Synechococcus sp. CBW1107]
MAVRPWFRLASTLLVAAWLSMTAAPARSEQRAGEASASALLPSWRQGAARERLLDFLRTVTTEGGEGYVPPEERIAVFDNDGTLWSEQPMYVQLAFAIERARGLVDERPELAAHPAVAAAIGPDGEARMRNLGMEGLLELVGLTHAGMSTDAFTDLAHAWIRSACHPTLRRPYTSLLYTPMRELLDLLRANGFRTYIVSAGGSAFMRVISEELYGIPPEQVIGSSIRTRYALQNGRPVILREAGLEVLNDGPSKPLLIERVIGRPPIAAFGNSDGDREMLAWTTSFPGARLGLLLHHDDAEREVAYDRHSAFGRLDRALDEASGRGWTVVSMRDDWAQVFPELEATAAAKACP